MWGSGLISRQLPELLLGLLHVPAAPAAAVAAAAAAALLIALCVLAAPAQPLAGVPVALLLARAAAAPLEARAAASTAAAHPSWLALQSSIQPPGENPARSRTNSVNLYYEHQPMMCKGEHVPPILVTSPVTGCLLTEPYHSLAKTNFVQQLCINWPVNHLKA